MKIKKKDGEVKYTDDIINWLNCAPPEVRNGFYKGEVVDVPDEIFSGWDGFEVIDKKKKIKISEGGEN